MQRSIAILLLVILNGCSATSPTVRRPAEWEPHDAIWIGYSADGMNEDGQRSVAEAMIRELTPSVRVVAVVDDEVELEQVRALMRDADINISRVDIYQRTPADFFIRDPGPIIVVDKTRRQYVADFSYANYTNVPPEEYGEKALEHDAIDRTAAEYMGLPTIRSGLAVEGGSIEVNGAGTAIVSECLARRNPHLTKAQIDAELHRMLGTPNVIWLGEGLATDPQNFQRLFDNVWAYGTGGHTDEFVRFVDERTIALAWVPDDEINRSPAHSETAERMRMNDSTLRRALDSAGRPFRIVHVPMPLDVPTRDWTVKEAHLERLRENGVAPLPEIGSEQRLTASASYLNYVISNGVILLPKFAASDDIRDPQSQRDDEVFAIFEGLFPGHRIVQINSLPINFRGGGMHCMTMEQPARRD